jgi:hypothetical protein
LPLYVREIVVDGGLVVARIPDVCKEAAAGIRFTLRRRIIFF